MVKLKTSIVSPLDLTADTPLYRQIYERLVAVIADGTLKPGDRIPSARALTTELGLARGTVNTAYELLAAEGYVVSRGQAGTIVTPSLRARIPTREVQPKLKAVPEAPSFRPDSILPFQMGLPALDMFPRKIWARLGANRIRAMQASDMVHPPVCGLEELRGAIATYLQVARGIKCAPTQVFVTSGYRHSIELISHALFDAGDQVWYENPGYPPTRQLMGMLNLSGVPIPVDEEGIDVARGIELAPRARAAIVTPAHQSPLCVTLSLPRRLALLEWAARNKGWIIEDDYDGEYRYVSRPLPALKSLDGNGRVLYAGTFSKVLMPSLRLAYLVVPDTLVERFEEVVHTLGTGTSHLVQAMVTSFMREGHFARHIQRMRRLYAERRDATVAGLESVLRNYVDIDAQPGGMHLILRLRGRRSDRRLVASMGENGLYAEALSDWGDGRQVGSALLVGFTNVDSQATAAQLGKRILALM
ncbi:PLP-dependent aminotransferase family protein [Paraburkholderia rhizosphaerae]|nr:PLP-dependent aminotransferase family protein [Paraburkholderia rhizosphaerae]